MKANIIIGSRLKDGWGNDWYVIDQDEKGYTLRGCRIPFEQHFLHQEIKNNFKLISR
jgi:hypothetical protein